MSDCIEWAKSCNSKGYGQQWMPDLKTYRGAHRMAWEKANGREAPKGMVVMHTCDNRKCVNPEHLVLGTYKDNTQDMLAKGRDGFTGEKQYRHKLTEKEVRQIRLFLKRHSGYGTGAFLGRWYGVTRQAISQVKREVNWRSNGLQDTRG